MGKYVCMGTGLDYYLIFISLTFHLHRLPNSTVEELLPLLPLREVLGLNPDPTLGVRAVPWLRRLIAGLSLPKARVRSRGQSMWDLWWTKWHWNRFLSELSVFPCQFHSTGAPLLVKLGKKNCSSSS
jgi:hypothetical protein